MNIDLLKEFGVALALALLVGLEREQKNKADNHDHFGGVRTFGLIGLLGVLAYVLAQTSIVYLILITIGFFGLLIVSYVISSKQPNNVGMTSEVAALLVYLLGILSGMQQYVLATAIALVIVGLLHFKHSWHNWARHIQNKEMIAALQFILIAFVVLPILPNQGFGPYDFFNPYVAWLMIVLISAISYASYIAIKLLGAKRGIGMTGFLAGFISSTALTLSFSEQSKKNSQVVNPYIVAIVVASSAMFFRILVEVTVINPLLLEFLLIPMLAMGFTGLLVTGYFWIKKENTPTDVQNNLAEIENPFSLLPALKFGLFFVAISFITKAANDYLGHEGLYATSFLSGLVDVDAITVSMANSVKEGTLTMKPAVVAVTIAAMTNTVIKVGIFALFGSKKVAWRLAGVLGLVLTVGSVSLWFV